MKIWLLLVGCIWMVFIGGCGHIHQAENSLRQARFIAQFVVVPFAEDAITQEVGDWQFFIERSDAPKTEYLLAISPGRMLFGLDLEVTVDGKVVYRGNPAQVSNHPSQTGAACGEVNIGAYAMTLIEIEMDYPIATYAADLEGEWPDPGSCTAVITHFSYTIGK